MYAPQPRQTPTYRALTARAFSPVGSLEVRLDRRGRATKPVRDLGDGQTLGLTEVAGQRDGAATLDHAVIRRRASAGDHASMYWLRRRNSRYSRCSGIRRAEWALAETDDEQARPKGGPRPSRAPRLDLAFLHSPGEGSVRRHPAAAHAGRPERYDVPADIELAPSRADCSSRGNAATVPSCPQGRQSGSHAGPRCRDRRDGLSAREVAPLRVADRRSPTFRRLTPPCRGVW